MVSLLTPPVLSEFDPVTESEGSVDPLSLFRTYERLAERILPFLTVRMNRVRFLTAMAVGAHVCSDYDDDALAADGLTPPWLVFEWHVAEALVRYEGDVPDRGGIPGRRKIEAVLRKKHRVNAASYLKTPKVFGFTGIYKTLATGLRILTGDLRLDDGGYELVRAWERDQGLDGFLGGQTGNGAEFRDRLRRAVDKGMKAAQTTKLKTWRWNQIAELFWPDLAGPKERKVLASHLARDDLDPNPELAGAAAMRSELLRHVTDRGNVLARSGEASFLRSIASKASAELRTRLGAIDAYEALCCPVNGAFALLRHLASPGTGGPSGADAFASDERARALAEQAAKGAAAIEAHPSLLDREPDIRPLADRYRGVEDAPSLLEAVVGHHEHAQREKPPDGKRPWIERGQKGGIVVRPDYAVDDPPEADADGYVHDYRTPTLSRFLADLGRIAW